MNKIALLNYKIAGAAQTASNVLLGTPWSENETLQNVEMVNRLVGGGMGSAAGGAMGLFPGMVASKGGQEIIEQLMQGPDIDRFVGNVSQNNKLTQALLAVGGPGTAKGKALLAAMVGGMGLLGGMAGARVSGAASAAINEPSNYIGKTIPR